MTRDGGLRIAGISLDCPDPAQLITFYVELLGGERLWDNPSSSGARVDGTVLIAQRVVPYARPTWPGTSIVHLDLSAGADLEESTARAVSLGATEIQPQPDSRWRVLLDPAGHPFCITTVTDPSDAFPPGVVGICAGNQPHRAGSGRDPLDDSEAFLDS